MRRHPLRPPIERCGPADLNVQVKRESKQDCADVPTDDRLLRRRREASSTSDRPLNIRMINLADPDLNFLVRQNERILTEIASLRDDMTVLTAMVMRLDGSVIRLEGSHTALLQEMHAVHTQIARMNDRVRKLEAEGTAT